MEKSLPPGLRFSLLHRSFKRKMDAALTLLERISGKLRLFFHFRHTAQASFCSLERARSRRRHTIRNSAHEQIIAPNAANDQSASPVLGESPSLSPWDEFPLAFAEP